MGRRGQVILSEATSREGGLLEAVRTSHPCSRKLKMEKVGCDKDSLMKGVREGEGRESKG